MPLETAAAYGAPTVAANSSSKRSIVGPSESRPDRRTSATSSSSRSSSHGSRREHSSRGRHYLGGAADISTTSRHWPHRLRPCTVIAGRRFCSSRVTGPDADLAVVDRAQRRNLRRGADHEYLVGEIEVGADEERLLDAVAEILSDLDDRVTGDPGQDRHRERRRPENAVLDDEDVLAGSIRDVAVVREHDGLVVSAAPRLHRGEHRVQVDPRCLRDVRDDVRTDPLPARDLGRDSKILAVLAEIRPPREADDRHVHRISDRGDAELAVPVEREWSEVARCEAVRGNEPVRRRAHLLDRVREVHVEHLGGVLESHEVVFEPEHGRPFGVS